MTKTVPPTTDTDEPSGYAATAAELRRIADAIEDLPGETPYTQLAIMPAETVEAIDAVTLAVLGKRGITGRSGNGWTHVAHGGSPTRNVVISIHASVPGPPDERDAELERLRAENAELRVRAMPEPYVEYLRSVDNGGTSAEVPTGVEGGPVTGRATAHGNAPMDIFQAHPEQYGNHVPGNSTGGE